MLFAGSELRYPLVIQHKYDFGESPSFQGKIHNKLSFSIAMLSYQRVHQIVKTCPRSTEAKSSVKAASTVGLPTVKYELLHAQVLEGCQQIEMDVLSWSIMGLALKRGYPPQIWPLIISPAIPYFQTHPHLLWCVFLMSVLRTVSSSEHSLGFGWQWCQSWQKHPSDVSCSCQIKHMLEIHWQIKSRMSNPGHSAKPRDKKLLLKHNLSSFIIIYHHLS